MSLSRTWYTNNNLALPDVTTALRSHASMWFNFKNQAVQALTGSTGASGAPPGSAAWTIHSSSDGVTAGAGDNLGGSTFTAGKWLRNTAGNAHSWFVLQSPNTLTDGTHYILISLGTSSDQNAIIAISKTAFSGGTTTADPTAANQSTFAASQTHPNTTTAGKTDYVVDANGNFHFWSGKNSAGYRHLWVSVMGLVEARSSGDTGRTMLCMIYSDTGRGAPPFLAVLPVRGWLVDGTTALTGSQGTIGYLNVGGGGAYVSQLTQNNVIDSKVDGIPAVYVFMNLAGNMGVRGRWPDVWYCGSGSAVGAGDPSGAAPTRVCMGGGIFPMEVAPTL